MAGLLDTLRSTSQALNVQNLQLTVAGKNLANVNNAGYARQSVAVTTTGAAPSGQGGQSNDMLVGQIQQIRSTLLDQQVTREIANTADAQAQSSAYQGAQAALGQTIDSTQTSTTTGGVGAGQGVATSLTSFFNAFSNFAANPTDATVRQSLIQQANVLTSNINQADQNLAQAQTDLTTQATADVASANTLLKSIATLNGQISQLEANSPGSASDLRDQRQSDLEQLAGFMSFQTSAVPGSSTQIVVSTSDGAGGQVPLVSGTTVTGPVTLSGSTLTAGSPATTISLSGGSINGGLTARDGAIQTLRDQLDQLAGQMVSSVNAAYNPSGSTGNFFTAGGTTAGTITVDPTVTTATLKASDGGAAGDNTIATAVAALAQKSFSTAGGDQIDGTFSGFFGSAVTTLGQTASNASTELTAQTAMQTAVTNQRSAVSGVSLDEETANLMNFQHAYQASARVMNIMSTLLDTVINMGA